MALGCWVLTLVMKWNVHKTSAFVFLKYFPSLDSLWKEFNSFYKFDMCHLPSSNTSQSLLSWILFGYATLTNIFIYPYINQLDNVSDILWFICCSLMNLSQGSMILRLLLRPMGLLFSCTHSLTHIFRRILIQITETY